MACFVRLRHVADEAESKAKVVNHDESTGMIWLCPQASFDVHEAQLRVKVDKVFSNSSNGQIWDLAVRARLTDVRSKQLTIVSYGADMIGEGSRGKMPSALQSLAMERPVWFRGVFASHESVGMFARVVQHLCEMVALRRAESRDVSLAMSIVKASGTKCSDLLSRTGGTPSWHQILTVDQAMTALRQALDRRMKDESFVVRLGLVEAKRRRLMVMLADVARVDRLSLLRCLAAVATGDFIPSRDSKLAHLLAPHLQTALYFFGLDELSNRAVALDVLTLARQAKRAVAVSGPVTYKGARRKALTEHNAPDHNLEKHVEIEELANATGDCSQNELHLAKSQLSQEKEASLPPSYCRAPANPTDDCSQNELYLAKRQLSQGKGARPSPSHCCDDIVAYYDAVIGALQSSLVEREITIRVLQSELARAREERALTVHHSSCPGPDKFAKSRH